MDKCIFKPWNSKGAEDNSFLKGFFRTFRFRMCCGIMCLVSSVQVVFGTIPNHYIVAFDQCVGKYHPDFVSKDILTKLDDVLLSYGLEKESDYVSMVAYGIEMGAPSVERFVRPYVSRDGYFLWRKLGNESFADLFPDWPNGQPHLRSGPFGSMQSLAKPYSVIETKSIRGSLDLAGKTYLILVSDGVVNGVDDNYAQEWNSVSTCPEANCAEFRKLAPLVFETMRNFNEEFKFVEVKFHNGNKTTGRWPISLDGVYKIVPYEVVSVDRPSIHSISDIPSPLPIQRVRGGFRINIDSNTRSPKYEISKIQLYDSKGEVLGSSCSGKIDIVLPSSKLKAGDSLMLSLSVILRDGLYNGVIITPDNPRYHDGMVLRQAIKIQDEAKVLGILPLSDTFWWWFSSDIFSAVMVWDLIILLILIIVIGYILYRCFVRINAYKPSNDKLKITKV